MKQIEIKRWPYLLAAASLFIYIVSTIIISGFYTLPADFAYIEAVLARQLAETHSFTVFPNQLSHGVASLLWEIILYPFAKMAPNILPVFMHILSILCVAVSVFVLSKWLIQKKFSLNTILLIISVFAISPPVMFAAISGSSIALGLLFSAILFYMLMSKHSSDTLLKMFYIVLLATALILIRPEAVFLIAFIWLLPTKETSISGKNLFFISVLSLIFAALIRKITLGNVFDGILLSTIGHRGLLGAISIHRVDTIEIMQSILLFAPFALFLFWASFSTLLIPASGAFIAFIHGNSDIKKSSLALLVFPTILFGLICAETSTGVGFRYTTVFLPALLLISAYGINMLFNKKIVISTTQLIILALSAIMLFALGVFIPNFDFGQYWNYIVSNVWKQVFILDAALIMTATISMVLFSSKNKTTKPYIIISIVLALLLIYPFLSQIQQQAKHLKDVATLIEKMEIVVKPTNNVAFATPGIGIWLRPQNSGDITGTLYEDTAIGNIEKPRDIKERSLSQLRRAMAWGAEFIICNPNTECPGAKENSEFQFVMKQNSAILLKAGSIKSNLLQNFGPTGSSPSN